MKYRQLLETTNGIGELASSCSLASRSLCRSRLGIQADRGRCMVVGIMVGTMVLPVVEGTWHRQGVTFGLMRKLTLKPHSSRVEAHA